MRINRLKLQIASCCLSILACAVLVQAQSGRRQPRVEPAAPIPTPTPEPTPTPKTEKKDSGLLLYVGMDRGSGFSYYPFTYYDAALFGCAGELREKTSENVDMAERELTRSEAVSKAKADAKTYVIYLQLRNPMYGSSSSSDSGDNIELEFIVFAPTTAKIVASGTSYQNGRRAGPIVVGPSGGSSSGLYRQELLKRAGQDAAQRILKSLHLNDPKTN